MSKRPLSRETPLQCHPEQNVSFATRRKHVVRRIPNASLSTTVSRHSLQRRGDRCYSLLMHELRQHVIDSGFAFPETLIHLFVGGSELHGAKVHGTDDLDIYGAYVEPPVLILGLESMPHFVWSTSGNEQRNGPHDVDITLYSLRKWAGLACKGNPTALHFLFAEGQLRNQIWTSIVARKDVFLARSCVKAFLGFADDQLKRITGTKGRGKKGRDLRVGDKIRL